MAVDKNKNRTREPIVSEVGFKVLNVDFNDSDHGEMPSAIKILAAVTHSGKVNKNLAFYHPLFVRDFSRSLVNLFGKPVLKNHDTSQDAIGRILDANYVDEITPAMKKRLVKAGVSDLAFTDKTVAEVLSDKGMESVSELMPLIVRDSKAILQVVGGKDNFKGLGEVQVVMKVTDSDSIQKIIDERFMTISISFGTEDTYCSAHAKEVYGGCWCGRGQKVDIPTGQVDEDDEPVTISETVFFVTGIMDSREVSYVNVPADEHARTIEIVQEDATEETPDKTKKDEVEEADNLEKDSINLSSWSEEDEALDIPAKIRAYADNLKAEEVDLDELINSDDENHSELLYQLMIDQLEEDELAELVKNDAKLTTKQRKALPDSDFCGPNRSFPAQDCAHVTSARRLVGRAKVGAATKAKILACVNRKAKKLGCGSSDNFAITYEKDDSNIGVIKLTLPSDVKEAVALLQDEEKFLALMKDHNIEDTFFDHIKKNVVDAAAKFGIDASEITYDAEKANIEKIEVNSPADEENPTDEKSPLPEDAAKQIETLTATLDKTNEDLVSLSESYNELSYENDQLKKDQGALIDQLISVQENARKAFVTSILSLEKAEDPDLTDEVLEERRKELNKRSLDSLQDTLKDVLKKNDVSFDNAGTEAETEENENGNENTEDAVEKDYRNSTTFRYLKISGGKLPKNKDLFVRRKLK